MEIGDQRVCPGGGRVACLALPFAEAWDSATPVPDAWLV
jgi:hypothetical protein